MIKLVALRVTEEISSHWSETLAWPALLVALHIALLIQVVLALLFLCAWAWLRGRSVYKKLTSEITTDNTTTT